MTATDRAVELARVIAKAADDKQGRDIVAHDVSEHLAITDIFVVVTADSERQVTAIMDEVEDRMREQGEKPARREGDREQRWVLLDFLDVVVHIQHTEERTLYALERLWGDCPTVDLQLPEAT